MTSLGVRFNLGNMSEDHRKHLQLIQAVITWVARGEDWRAVLKACPVSLDDLPPRRRELARRRKQRSDSATAEPSAPPAGGSATRVVNPGVTEGPAPVS